MGKSTVSMAMFNSKLLNYQRARGYIWRVVFYPPTNHQPTRVDRSHCAVLKRQSGWLGMSVMTGFSSRYPHEYPMISAVYHHIHHVCCWNITIHHHLSELLSDLPTRNPMPRHDEIIPRLVALSLRLLLAVVLVGQIQLVGGTHVAWAG